MYKRQVYDTLRALREGQVTDTLTDVPSAELIGQLTRASSYEEAIHTYLEPLRKT